MNNDSQCIIQASLVQWLGFHPSKVEVGVRFAEVARTSLAPFLVGSFVTYLIFLFVMAFLRLQGA